MATGETGGISRAVERRLADGFAVSMNHAGHAQVVEETVAESSDEHNNA